jgi:hypothetical protein
MRILTLDNIHYDLDHLPEEVDDMRFAILDNSNPQDPDYHFIPLDLFRKFQCTCTCATHWREHHKDAHGLANTHWRT